MQYFARESSKDNDLGRRKGRAKESSEYICEPSIDEEESEAEDPYFLMANKLQNKPSPNPEVD